MSTATLPANADPTPGPNHVAIIMDGNGRWAKARGLPRVAGHRRGADAVRRVVRGAGELGIPVLTLFAFSTENWTRAGRRSERPDGPVAPLSAQRARRIAQEWCEAQGHRQSRRAGGRHRSRHF